MGELCFSVGEGGVCFCMNFRGRLWKGYATELMHDIPGQTTSKSISIQIRNIHWTWSPFKTSSFVFVTVALSKRQRPKNWRSWRRQFAKWELPKQPCTLAYRPSEWRSDAQSWKMGFVQPDGLVDNKIPSCLNWQRQHKGLRPTTRRQGHCLEDHPS